MNRTACKDQKTWGATIVAAGLAVCMAGAVVLMVLSGGLGGVLSRSDAEPITARITLDNRCALRGDALVVRDLETGQAAPFLRGVARLQTAYGNRVRLEIAPRYPDVELESPVLRARADMVLRAECRGRWLEDLFAR